MSICDRSLETDGRSPRLEEKIAERLQRHEVELVAGSLGDLEMDVHIGVQSIMGDPWT